MFQQAVRSAVEGIVSKRLGLALPIRTVAGLAEVQEPGGPGGEARGRGRLEKMSPSEVRPGEICIPEVRPDEVRTPELRVNEVWTDTDVLATPGVPSFHPFLEYRDLLVVRHGNHHPLGLPPVIIPNPPPPRAGPPEPPGS